jgi:hypothetical protein
VPEVLWQAIFNIKKNNKKHYRFFKTNKYLFKDKLIKLFTRNFVTGEHAYPISEPLLNKRPWLNNNLSFNEDKETQSRNNSETDDNSLDQPRYRIKRDKREHNEH